MINPGTGLPSLDIWVMQRASLDAPWGTPQNLGPKINSPYSDQCPRLAPDGYTLIFASNRPGGLGQHDLYMAHRSNQRDDFGWDFAENMGSAVNSSFQDYTPGSFEDENGNFILYFSSTRPGGPGGADVYTSVMQNDGTFGPAVLVPELSSKDDDFFPIPRRDGLELFLSSSRAGTLGGRDLWVSTRASTSAPWSTPVNLGPSINSTANDEGTGMPFSETSLIFNSDRQGGAGGFDLYEIKRPKLASGLGSALSRAKALGLIGSD